jgi:hypothetical protein
MYLYRYSFDISILSTVIQNINSNLKWNGYMSKKDIAISSEWGKCQTDAVLILWPISHVIERATLAA